MPISIDYIIVGQGICGTLLSYKLLQAGKIVLVFDDQRAAAAWPVASGLINPITGQRLAKAWRIDELLPAAIAMYRELEVLLMLLCLLHIPYWNFSRLVHAGVRDYREHISPLSMIPKYVVKGFQKACHLEYKFDSKAEKDFAQVCEDDEAVLK